MNEKEILRRLNECKTEEEYDAIIDKYIFKINKKKHNAKNSIEYSFVSTEAMKKRRSKEVLINYEIL